MASGILRSLWELVEGKSSGWGGLAIGKKENEVVDKMEGATRDRKLKKTVSEAMIGQMASWLRVTKRETWDARTNANVIRASPYSS